jgi:NAD(P)-dependent dehydrogenase (short-subunit alcohol dehydrogenase family)
VRGVRLRGKIALVTGAGSGIGRAACELFAAEGAKVVAVDRDPDTAAATADAVHGLAVAGDVSTEDLWARAVAAAAGLDGLDLVYLNAGVYGSGGAIEDLPFDVYRAVVDANIGGVVLGTRAVVPLLRSRGGGAIVATASIAGIVAFPGNALYTMSKHAVTGFVQAAAPALAASDITINAVCPGVVDTPMTVGALGGADPKAVGIPLIDPADVAATALDLALSDANGVCRWVRAGADSVDWRSPDFHDLLPG